MAIVDEAVLRKPVGGSGVQRSQPAHLAKATELPTVSMHVLPAGLGAHPSLASGFTVRRSGSLDVTGMVYVEHAFGSATLEKEPHIVVARLKFERLRSLASTQEESREVIRRIADEL